MAGRDGEANSWPDTGLFTRRNFFDLSSVLLDPARQGMKIGMARHLERHVVHARSIGRPQDDAVMAELVPGPEIDPAIRLTADLVETDAIDITADRGIQI